MIPPRSRRLPGYLPVNKNFAGYYHKILLWRRSGDGAAAQVFAKASPLQTGVGAKRCGFLPSQEWHFNRPIHVGRDDKP
jgi:hypothetical protein